jgi:hypothetical protein
MTTQPKTITHIVVHHSASPLDTDVEEIRRWHMERGFSDIGYHKIITNDGIIHEARPENIVPASVKGKNKGTVAVCLTGNFDRYMPTEFQLIALQLQILKWKEGHPTAKVVGHRDLGSSECPGSFLYAWLKQKYPEG